MKAQLFTIAFLIRLAINAGAMILLVRMVYQPIYQKRDFNFTFYLLNFVVFVLTFLMEKTGSAASLGTGVGLVAAFSLLRLRTETISIKDMTYLFMILTLGLVNAIMAGPFYELITLNAVIVVLAFVLDADWVTRNINIKTIELDSIDNIQPDKQSLLIADLRQRTGLDIKRISVENIDLGKKRASVKIYYY
ncbi:MAG: DUF4956 domain-containing protein [Cytophagales bacterium]|nr:DUF4956 domain-containing protein [Cytophagales bacterium]